MLGVVVLGQTALVEQVAMLELVAVVVLVQQVEVVALEMLAAEVSLVAEGHGRWESRVAAPKDEPFFTSRVTRAEITTKQAS